jgi:hypothetical protein
MSVGTIIIIIVLIIAFLALLAFVCEKFFPNAILKHDMQDFEQKKSHYEKLTETKSNGVPKE